MKKLAVVSLAIAGILSATAFAQTKPEDAIKYRKSAMALIGYNFGSIGAMVNDKKPYNKDEAIRSASQMNVDEMARYINADSLAFITIDGLYRALGDQRDATVPQRCDACFTGNYPTTLTDCDKDGKLKPLSLVASR